MHSHDRPSGSAAPAAEPDDLGPPDWFAAVALPEPEPGPEPPPGPEESAAEGAGTPGALGVPGLLTASALPSGRRRRRSALTPEPPAPAADTTGYEAAYKDAPEPPARATRRRGRTERTEARPAGRAEDQVDPATRARDICLRLLTGHARTRKQLADALRKREIPDDVADEVLSRYEEVGLIDDAAFAAAWVDSRHGNRGLSRRALAQELRRRGVSGDHAEQALARVDAEDEAEAARALVERKLPGTRGLETQTRTRRLVAMLARRGYSEGLAYRVVRDALGAESEGFGEDW
ncbi:regulatory protein RecX [Kitasatospora sp. NBC_01539]|uniref:regulatory protein RecX n=1 Tax=Kitasatospora sp. NBC_01539 TaxID=2903577 RepID=UPI0038602FC2